MFQKESDQISNPNGDMEQEEPISEPEVLQDKESEPADLETPLEVEIPESEAPPSPDEEEPVAPVPPIESVLSSLIQPLEENITALKVKLGVLSDKLENKIVIDDIRDRTIDRLHSELMACREDQLFKAMKPLINGIIDVADDLRSVILNRPEDEVAGQLGHFRTMLHDALAWVDVSAYNSQNQAFDASRHSSVKTEVTDNPDLDKVIAHSMLTGYLHNETILRKEKVCVYKYEPPAETESQAEKLMSETTNNKQFQ